MTMVFDPDQAEQRDQRIGTRLVVLAYGAVAVIAIGRLAAAVWLL